MNSEKQKILEMLENGSISAQEAAQLLDCLGDDKEQKPGERPVEAVPGIKNKNSGKKIRIMVKGADPENKKIDVNVSVPMALARMVDGIVENCLPDSANKELAKQGINLKALKLGELMDTMETLDEDIVDVDIDGEDTKMKVKVYVE